jgi:hypothetical protein
LNDSSVGIGFHQSDQGRNRRAGHHAVSIQDDHITVTMTPAAAKIGDVSALSVHGEFTPAIVKFTEPIGLAAEVGPGHPLFRCPGRVRRVAQDKEVVRFQLPSLLERIM